MVAWGEFAFIIATAALNAGLPDQVSEYIYTYIYVYIYGFAMAAWGEFVFIVAIAGLTRGFGSIKGVRVHPSDRCVLYID